METALLFERDAVEEVDDWSDCFPRLGRSSVLWIDLERPDGAEIDRLAELLELRPDSVRGLTEDHASGKPTFSDFGDYLHVSVLAPSDDDELKRVDCLVSKRWVVTVREGPLEVVDTFRERASGSGDTGRSTVSSSSPICSSGSSTATSTRSSGSTSSSRRSTRRPCRATSPARTR